MKTLCRTMVAGVVACVALSCGSDKTGAKQYFPTLPACHTDCAMGSCFECGSGLCKITDEASVEGRCWWYQQCQSDSDCVSVGAKFGVEAWCWLTVPGYGMCQPSYGGSTAPRAGGADAGPSAQAEAAAATWCARLKECDFFSFTSHYDDDATCVARSLEPFAAALQTPDIGVTDAYLLACLNARAAASCESISLGLPTAECTPVAGTRTTGAQCYADGQCASLTCLTGSVPGGATVTCGVCSSGKTSGAVCTADADCEGLLYCVNGVCGELGGLASPCATSADCVGALMCLSGVCAAPLALGALCTSDTDCGPEASCVAGSCQLDQLVAVGETCGPLDGGGYAQCAGQAVCYSGRCVLPPSVGQSCTTSGPDCAGQARCTSGVCRPFDASLCPN